MCGDSLRVALLCRLYRREVWWAKHGRFTKRVVLHYEYEYPLSGAQHPSDSQMAPSRQERRKAERDAAKRAPAQARAVRAAVSVNPVGDWTTQEEDGSVLYRALGSKILVKQKADAGDRAAQYAMGVFLTGEADAAMSAAGLSHEAGKSPKAEAGLARCTFLTRPRCVDVHLDN